MPKTKSTFAFERSEAMHEGSGLTMETKLGRRVQVIDDCWIVDGKADRYLRIKIGGEVMPAHRWIYLQTVGPLEDGEHVHHTCQHPGCIRPAHLMALSASDHSKLHADLRRSAA